MRKKHSKAYFNNAIVSVLFILFVNAYFFNTDERSNPVITVNAISFTENDTGIDASYAILLTPKRILLWTPIFRDYLPDSYLFRDCADLKKRCIIDYNRSHVAAANAVIFHGPVIADHPLPPPLSRSRRQRYVFATQESPENTFHPWSRYAELENFFNWTMTPLFSSDVIYKYGGYWLTADEAQKMGFKDNTNDEFNISTYVNKIPSILALISNCDTHSKREDALREINKFFHVTLTGKCAQDPKFKVVCQKYNANCNEVMSKYAFVFAGENTVCKDYVSEKYWARKELSSILIVLKRSDYVNINLPPHSIIALDDFDSPQALSEYLWHLVNNQTAFAEYFAWRKQGWMLAPPNTEGYRNGFCRLCERLWEPLQEEKVIPHVRAWYEQESSCDNNFVTKWIGQGGTNSLNFFTDTFKLIEKGLLNMY